MHLGHTTVYKHWPLRILLVDERLWGERSRRGRRGSKLWLKYSLRVWLKPAVHFSRQLQRFKLDLLQLGQNLIDAAGIAAKIHCSLQTHSACQSQCLELSIKCRWT
jgi:hypothetical protein